MLTNGLNIRSIVKTTCAHQQMQRMILGHICLRNGEYLLLQFLLQVPADPFLRMTDTMIRKSLRFQLIGNLRKDDKQW